MAIGVKGAQNRVNVMGFDVTTSDHTLTGVLSKSDLATVGGFNYIFKIRAEVTGGDAELFPLGRPNKIGPPDDPLNLTDVVASNAAAAQATVVVTNVDRFTAGDYVYLQDNTYTNFEWGRIASIVTLTDTLTLDTNLTNTYNVAAGAEIAVCMNHNSRMPLTVGFLCNEAGLNFPSLYVRKLQAGDVRVKGYAVMA
jgi:hypothetical protein